MLKIGIIRLTVSISLVVAVPVLALAGSPRLTLSEAEFNFGFVPQNARITHVFWLHSTGNDTLKITRVVPGCGCTQAPLDKSLIPQSDSGKLEIIFDTQSYQGNVLKVPRIQTNEVQSDKPIRILADVVRKPDSTYPIVVKPYKLDITQYGEKVRDTINFTITNVSDLPLQLTSIACPRDLFDVTLPQSIPPRKTASSLLKLSKKAIGMKFEKSLTIQLNDEKASRFTIPVRRELRNSDSTLNAVPMAPQSGH